VRIEINEEAMKYQILCQHLSVGRPTGEPANKGDVLDGSELSHCDVEELVKMGAIAPISADSPAGTLEAMTRKELNALAEEIGLDTTRLGSKAKVVCAISERQAELATPAPEIDSQ
jgi:hypothetical protein